MSGPPARTMLMLEAAAQHEGLQRGYATRQRLSRLLLLLIEIFQVGRRLARPRRRQVALIADHIVLLAEHDLMIVLRTNKLVPDRVALAMVAPGHDPGSGQGMIDRGDLVMQE